MSHQRVKVQGEILHGVKLLQILTSNKHRDTIHNFIPRKPQLKTSLTRPLIKRDIFIRQSF